MFNVEILHNFPLADQRGHGPEWGVCPPGQAGRAPARRRRHDLPVRLAGFLSLHRGLIRKQKRKQKRKDIFHPVFEDFCELSSTVCQFPSQVHLQLCVI